MNSGKSLTFRAWSSRAAHASPNAPVLMSCLRSCMALARGAENGTECGVVAQGLIVGSGIGDGIAMGCVVAAAGLYELNHAVRDLRRPVRGGVHDVVEVSLVQHLPDIEEGRVADALEDQLEVTLVILEPVALAAQPVLREVDHVEFDVVTTHDLVESRELCPH